MIALFCQRIMSVAVAVLLAIPNVPLVQKAAATATPAPTAAVMVWLSRTGTKYHRWADCSNMKDPWQVSLDEAIEKGRTPCKKCY